MNIYIKYLIVAILLSFMDFIWISLNFKMYNKTVKDIQGFEPKINVKYAIIAYAFMILSLFYIAIPFTMNYINKYNNYTDILYKSVMYGGVVGLSIYGIYNFTCLSFFDKYPLSTAIIDTIWGTFLYSFVVFVFFIL
uniref:DUF2177 domain-containing protein n=1 Tax=Virus NIOZ-UU159 TaxID=2763270 RepID=A0A7S9SUJ0_9VIRU|nr:MAG: hypothetical protein NIOZUU159_00174 [Virus NIOZ-UU159]